MHYVLEVQALFYRDMLIQIWQVIKIVHWLVTVSACDSLVTVHPLIDCEVVALVTIPR
jgi:hypothetical protein